MATLKLTPDPTWIGKVKIPAPVPEGHVVLELEFKHRKLSEMEGFFEAMKEKTVAQGVMACAVRWVNLEESWTEENVKAFLDSYHAAARTIIKEYVDQLSQFRLGN